MKKLFLISIICLMVITMNAQKCAVLEFRGAKSISVADVDGISEMFMTYFHPSGYTMIERAQIDKVISEHDFQRSELTDEQTIQVGKFLNASKIVVGKVSMLGGQYQVDVRVVDVELGHDIAFEGATFNGDYRTNIRNLATNLASKIAITPVETVIPAVPEPVVIEPVATQQQTEPYIIYGYLKVFPNDLGTFDTEPKTVISRLNQSQQYGYGTWRLPTNEELDLMRANDLIGEDKYMTIETSFQRNIVRLVTDQQKGETKLFIPGYVDLGLPSGTLWKNQNETGGFYTYNQAKAKFGENLPTKEQLEELKDSCQWTWTGSGYKVTGPSGESITLPAAGYRYSVGSVSYVGTRGYYWSSTLCGTENAWYYLFARDCVSMDNRNNCHSYGHSIRLVKKP